MDPTTDIADFYDRLAPDYDVMTGFEKRFVRERPFFQMLVERYGISTAVDAGSGTGFHSLLLSQLGVRVTAVDVSSEMLRRLSSHANEVNAQITAVHSQFSELAGRLHEPVDAVFCMGNTLAHLLSRDVLCDTLKTFNNLLRPGGVLFVQVLNFERILALRERVQNVRKEGDVTFVRYYDFENELVRFNILRMQKEGEETRQVLSTITLRPVLQREFAELLTLAGFVGGTFFGDITMVEFDPQSSQDLVLIATKHHP